MTELLQPEEERYASGAATVALALLQARSANLRPPPRLTLSQWAAAHAVLSPETSAQTGPFEAYAYQVEMMDAVTDPAVTQVTVMKSARVGYTKILDNVVGYFIAQDPSPMLLVQPRVEDAEDYSATEIAPMLRDTKALADITGDLKAKDAKQKLLKRVFRNGASISFVGANSPGGFRRITARVIMFDEVDGYVLRAMRSMVATKFGRVKLAADGTRLIPGSNVVTPSTIKAELIALYRQLEAEGMVQQADVFAANLIVEKNAQNPNRVDVLWPGTLINQLRVFATLIQFRLN